MDKLKMHSPDLSQANIEKIQTLFPNCVTEVKGENSEIKLAVDFDMLKQELSGSIVEGPKERYHLNWPGKREAVLHAHSPIKKTLRPEREKSVNFDTTGNLFIEGDNLQALKLLQESYLGKVKLIYIDPPYNTGRDFIYKDDFREETRDYLERSNQLDEVGNYLTSNPRTNGRFHSDWTSMMFPRLKLARNLLADNGAIFVSIGQEELASSCNMLNEIFGESNFVTIISRVMKKGGQKGVHFSPCVDYVLVYARNIFGLEQFREEISQNVIDKVYTRVMQSGARKGEKYRAMGLYQAMLDKRPNQRYFIECPDGSLVIPPGETMPQDKIGGAKVLPNDGDGVWRWTYERFEKEKALGNVEFIQSDRTTLVNSDGSRASWNVYYRIWLKDRLNDGQLPGNILEKFESRHSSSELKELGIPFDFPKPVNLIKYFMGLMNISDDEIVLDFFAGSGTTGHAVMEYSVETKQNCHFICVQLDEPLDQKSTEYKQGFRNIADISAQRLRKAGEAILRSYKGAEGHVGFRKLVIDSTNMKEVFYDPTQINQSDLFSKVDNIKDDRSNEDLLFQVLLDLGVGLTSPIFKQDIASREVFFVNADETLQGADLIACFATDVSNELIKTIAEKQPLRVIFRDDGYATDAVKINVEQIFKQISPITDVKSI